jgi:hypothetical protein
LLFDSIRAKSFLLANDGDDHGIMRAVFPLATRRRGTTTNNEQQNYSNNKEQQTITAHSISSLGYPNF